MFRPSRAMCARLHPPLVHVSLVGPLMRQEEPARPPVELIILTMDGIFNLLASFAYTHIATRFSADARQELYASLLGKSQTFHSRQRVGDLMARATDDVALLSDMVTPGASLLIESTATFAITLVFIGLIDPRLLLVPGLFIIAYIFAVRGYVHELEPVTARLRYQFGQLDAVLAEILSGIEVVKASARELFEREAVDIIAPDFQKVGGLLEGRRIADMADVHYLTVAPHNISGPIGTMAAVHVSAAIPNFLALEWHAASVPFFDDLPIVPWTTVRRVLQRAQELDPENWRRNLTISSRAGCLQGAVVARCASGHHGRR